MKLSVLKIIWTGDLSDSEDIKKNVLTDFGKISGLFAIRPRFSVKVPSNF